MDPGKSRTHGEPDGERLDISDLLEETLAVSAPMQEFILIDQTKNQSSYFNLYFLLSLNSSLCVKEPFTLFFPILYNLIENCIKCIGCIIMSDIN